MLLNTIEEWRTLETKDMILNKAMKKNNKHLFEDFSKRIEFSPSGLSCKMDAGGGAVNIHTIATAAKAYSKYLKSLPKECYSNGIVVGNDGRPNSFLYASVLSSVLIKEGITVYSFNKINSQPTSLLSFSINEMKLSGGVMITSDVGDFKVNGFKLLDEKGTLFGSANYLAINSIMSEMDLNRASSIKNSPTKYIPPKVISDYKKIIISDIHLEKNLINASYSPLGGSLVNFMGEALVDRNIRAHIVESQGNSLNDNLKIVSSNPTNAEVYNKVISLARKNKSDVAFVSDSAGEKLGVVVKYQRRYKYLSGNQIAALYLEYKLSNMASLNKIPKDAFIIKTTTSGNLSSLIAKRYGVRVLSVNPDQSKLSKAVSDSDGTLIMAFDGEFGLIVNRGISPIYDAASSMMALIEVINHHKSKGINTFEHLKALWAEYGIHRSVKNSLNLDKGMGERLLKNILKLKNISGQKVVSKFDYRKQNKENLFDRDIIKITLANGSWFAITPSLEEGKVETFIETKGDGKQKIMDIVIFEKEIESIISENSEFYPEKKISKKTVFKYLLFLSIMGLTMFMVFKFIYDGTRTNGDTYSVAKEIFTSNSRWIFLIGFISYFFPVFLHSFQKKRLIGALGQKVKWRHLAISAFMGTFVSWITPFAIGGDAIGYWFLRRKGFKRGPLASSFLMGTIIYQFQIVLVSSILLPMGIVMFHDQIFNGSAEMKTIIILFIIGACWNLFATFMIYMLTFNKRFQEWIVKTTIKLLEWLPFMHIQDPGKLAGTHQFTFYEIRTGMKLLSKKKMLLLECTFYEIVTSFINFAVVIPILLGVVQPDLKYGDYFSLIVASDVSGTANSYSITPGGSGTGEYISMVINSNVYKPLPGLGNSSATATALDMISKLTSWWPLLIGSLISILVVIAGEKRTRKYKIMNRNNSLKNIESNHKTSFYKKVSIPLLLAAVAFFLLYFLIF